MYARYICVNFLKISGFFDPDLSYQTYIRWKPVITHLKLNDHVELCRVDNRFKTIKSKVLKDVQVKLARETETGC